MNMKYSFLLLFVLILMGAGCRVAPSIPETMTTVVPVDSPFRGVDGSLTANAFDRAADGFMTWVFSGERELSPETVEALVTKWREETGDEYPMTDTFQGIIVFRLPSWPERVLQVRSAGADGEIDTKDDFVRHYPFRDR